MIHLKHLKGMYEFGSIEPNPKKHKKNAKIRLRYGRTFSTKVRGTVLSARKLFKFHCTFLTVTGHAFKIGLSLSLKPKTHTHKPISSGFMVSNQLNPISINRKNSSLKKSYKFQQKILT